MKMTEVRKTILIASVLKPVNDTRMTEKIATTLANSGQFRVHVIGSSAPTEYLPSFHVHQLGSFKRLSLARLLAPIRVFAHVLSIKPDLLMVCTHELLITAVVSKLILRCNIVYDVQENYYRNIRFTNAFPPVLRNILALSVRVKEKICAPFIDHFILAEASYAKELSFLRKRFTVVENKVRKPSARRTDRSKNQLLFTGTLAETTGVFIAIDIARALHAIDPTVRLLVIGYAARASDQRRLRQIASTLSFVSLVGVETPVPHEQILKAIGDSAAGIISYPLNPSTAGSVPTKLFEYLGYNLPIILTSRQAWVQICEPFNAAIVLDPSNFDPKGVLSQLSTRQFYNANSEDIFWENEESRLISLISSL